MKRAVAIHEAISHLKHPYTYTIMEGVSAETIKNRKTLGYMASESLVDLRNEMLRAAMVEYINLKMSDEQSKTGYPTDTTGSEKRPITITEKDFKGVDTILSNANDSERNESESERIGKIDKQT